MAKSTLSDSEAKLLDAIKKHLGGSNLLQDESYLPQFLYENINQQFRLGVLGLSHEDGICASFYKVHGVKHLNSPLFSEMLECEMKSQGIPADQRKTAIETKELVLKKLLKEMDEKDAGVHPDIDEIKKVSQPPQYE
jgi:hypothetical protein